ncbi:MAG: hypothetical protein ACYC3I_18140 [Gemmataceae bacterium]
MQAIRSVFAVFGNLAASVNALAGVLDTATGRLRQQLAFDGEPTPILEHQPAEPEPPAPKRNGRVKV